MIQSSPGNPDIKFPPNNLGQQAIVTSNPGEGWEGSPLINNWVEAPASGASLLASGDGTISWNSAPQSGTFVLASVDGTIQWIETEACEE